MRKGIKIFSRLVFATMVLTLLSPLSLADTIILKNGQSVVADKIDEREEDITFYLQGLKMRVSKSMVVRIDKTNAASVAPPARAKRKAAKIKPPSKKIVRAEKAVNASPPPPKAPSGKIAEKKKAIHPGVRAEKKMKNDPKPSEKQPDTQTEKIRSEIRSCGLRDLRWGINRSAIGIMQEIETGSHQMDIKEYVRKNEDLKLGKAQLDSIVYAFWRYRLYTVTIWVSGHDNYVALRNEIFNRFGLGLKSENHPERYLWSDTYSDRMLKYVEADQTGLFWMRSKDLNRKYQLSQLKAPSTVLKAMEAKALRAN